MIRNVTGPCDRRPARGLAVRRRRPSLAVVSLIGILIGTAACADTTTTDIPTTDIPTTDIPTDSGQPSAVNLDPLTVNDILAAVSDAGLPVPNPRDVTQQECPDIGCTNKVDTDTVSIMKFASPGGAQLYAGSTHGVFQVVDVVLKFSPGVPPGQQRDYELAVKRAVR
jgi:hypothetical protein